VNPNFPDRLLAASIMLSKDAAMCGAGARWPATELPGIIGVTVIVRARLIEPAGKHYQPLFDRAERLQDLENEPQIEAQQHQRNKLKPMSTDPLTQVLIAPSEAPGLCSG